MKLCVVGGAHAFTVHIAENNDVVAESVRENPSTLFFHSTVETAFSFGGYQRSAMSIQNNE